MAAARAAAPPPLATQTTPPWRASCRCEQPEIPFTQNGRCFLPVLSARVGARERYEAAEAPTRCVTPCADFGRRSTTARTQICGTGKLPILVCSVLFPCCFAAAGGGPSAQRLPPARSILVEMVEMFGGSLCLPDGRSRCARDSVLRCLLRQGRPPGGDLANRGRSLARLSIGGVPTELCAKLGRGPGSVSGRLQGGTPPLLLHAASGVVRFET